jgi:hypothetical protein
MGRAKRALECYRVVCHLEEEESLIWVMAKIGELVLKLGIRAMRDSNRGGVGVGVGMGMGMAGGGANAHTSAGAGASGGNAALTALTELLKTDNDPDTQKTTTLIIQKCLQGVWGESMIIVGRLIQASVTEEVVRAKYVILPSCAC